MKIAGVSAPGRTDLPVLKPYDINSVTPDGYIFTRWLAGLPWWTYLTSRRHRDAQLLKGWSA